jgi:hypothetical protein
MANPVFPNMCAARTVEVWHMTYLYIFYFTTELLHPQNSTSSIMFCAQTLNMQLSFPKFSKRGLHPTWQVLHTSRPPCYGNFKTLGIIRLGNSELTTPSPSRIQRQDATPTLLGAGACSILWSRKCLHVIRRNFSSVSTLPNSRTAGCALKYKTNIPSSWGKFHKCTTPKIAVHLSCQRQKTQP